MNNSEMELTYSKEKGYRFIIISFVIIIVFRLTTPFNYSDVFLLRLFTENKIISYFFVLLILRLSITKKLDRVKNIPGLNYLILLMISQMITSFLVDNTEETINFLLYTLGGIFFYLIIVSSFVNLKSLKLLANVMIVFGVILIVLDKSNILQITDLLSKSQIALDSIGQIQAQTLFESTLTKSIMTRFSILWFDANNIAYLLAFLFLFNLHFLINETKNKKHLILRLTTLYIFLIPIILTLSRGANLALFVSIVFVFIFSKSAKKVKSKILIKFFLISICLFIIILPFIYKEIIELSDRFFLGLGLLGYKKSSLLMTGLEEVRWTTGLQAFEDFLERPLFGWGAYKMGWVGNTGNHMFYLNFLGHWGLAGFSLLILTHYKILKYFKSRLLFVKNISNLDYNLGITIFALFIVDFIRGFFAANSFYFVLALLTAYSKSIEIKYRNYLN